MIQYQIYLGMRTHDIYITTEMIKEFIDDYIVNILKDFTVTEGYGYWNNICEKVSIITIITDEIDNTLYDKIKNICLNYKRNYNQECVLLSETKLINYEMIYI